MRWRALCCRNTDFQRYTTADHFSPLQHHFLRLSALRTPLEAVLMVDIMCIKCFSISIMVTWFGVYYYTSLSKLLALTYET